MKKKAKVPKKLTMSIRYTDEDIKKIEKMQFRLGEKTMAKAFLAAPDMIEEQTSRIAAQSITIETYQERIRKLERVVSNWINFFNSIKELEGKK